MNQNSKIEYMSDSEIEGATSPDSGKIKLTKWSNEPSLETLKGDFDASKSYQKDMTIKIEDWLNALNIEGPYKPKTGPNKSKIQPKLVRKQAEWRYSALTESFLSSEKLFTVEPTTFEDVEAAEQNELVLNWQFRTLLNPVKFIDELVRTTVDEGTAFIKVGWIRDIEEVEVEVPQYVYVPLNQEDPEQEEILQMIQEGIQLHEENPRGFNELEEDIKESVSFSLESGVPHLAQFTGEYITEIEENVLENRPTVEFVDFRNIYFDPSCNGDLDKAKFCVISFETSRSALEKDGRYHNLDKISYSSETSLNNPSHNTNTPNTFNFKDKARKNIVAYEYWGFYDVNGDGKLVPFVATWVGNVLIRMEENPFPDNKIPVVAIPYMPLKKKIYGETDATLLTDSQSIVGALSRGVLDSLARTANGQRGYPKGLLDSTNQRRYDQGLDFQYNPSSGDPRNSIIESRFPDLPPSALNFMSLQHQEAESLTGVKSFTGGLSGDSYGRVVAGIQGLLDASSKREMAILRRLAQGMKEIGSKFIAMNSLFLNEEEVVRVTNEKFITIRREDLKGNFDLIVDISTTEIDEAKANDLSMMLQTIGNNMDGQMRNMILSEIAALKRMPRLAKQLKNYQPEPDPLEQRARELELERFEIENEIKKLEIEEMKSIIQLNQVKARKLNSDADLADLDFVEQETGTKHARDLEKSSEQARANSELEITKSLLRPKKQDEIDGNIDAAIGFGLLRDSGRRT